MDKTSYDFLDVLRGTIEDKVSTLDQTIYCKIVGINEDYTLDVTVIPDETTRIRSVVNASKYEFNVGDYGILYKIGNNLANAFIIAKLGPSYEDNQPLSKRAAAGSDGDGSGGTVVNNYYQTINSVVAGDGLTSSGTDTVTVSLGTPSASGSGSNTYGSNSVTAESHTHQIKLPDATDSAKGVVQLAADNDTTSTNKAVTPKQLETARKNAEVSITASNGLTGGGTGHSLSVALGTPSTVNQTSTNSTTATSHTHKLEFTAVSSPAASGNTISFIDTVSQGVDGGISATKKTVRSASTTQTGVVRLATQNEVNTGTDTKKVITPATLGKGKASGVASLDANGKIILSQIPDAVYGNVLYGGNLTEFTDEDLAASVSISSSLRARLGLADTVTTITVANATASSITGEYGYASLEGVYFICEVAGSWGLTGSFEVGDWMISTGTSWQKVDNTDAVKSVNGQIGDVNITRVNEAGTADKVSHAFTVSEGETPVVQYDGSKAIGLDFDAYDFTTSGSVSSCHVQLSSTGVNAGTYNTVTVDGNGRVTAGTNVSHIQRLVYTITGNGSAKTFNITHPLDADITVQVYLVGQTVDYETVDELVMVDTYVLAKKVKLVFATAPSASQTFKVVMIGALDESVPVLLKPTNVSVSWKDGDKNDFIITLRCTNPNNVAVTANWGSAVLQQTGSFSVDANSSNYTTIVAETDQDRGNLDGYVYFSASGYADSDTVTFN